MIERVNILFHGIGEPGPHVEADAYQYFIPRDLFVKILDEVAGNEHVRISFDDGFTSDVDIALPELESRGLTATFFPLAGRFGDKGRVSVAGVRELVAAGMRIGSHGMDHVDWRYVDPATRNDEMDRARDMIGQASERSVAEAAIPFGWYDRSVLAALRGYGYRTVYTSDRRRAVPGRWLQPRYSIVAQDTIESVRAKVLAQPSALRRTRDAAAVLYKRLR
ncbi:polysaccharide deacetylase family protein [Nonomuraea soli]|uniref:Peptidoglycan/xylan/chitin deacetylase (PgdA/CDA1 family) n=1 Tax=Nonomuraea soli TaxID=1032476 RepID=A0A7W0HWL3_9ACTN|nr:polysaccharide deacetylase family protein [Nonomuraea soli]MBA2897971.1 peptidoglycan/xylan/chitin deacetylase (PgdA/CDA1 family) [Nonomuraea soli]